MRENVDQGKWDQGSQRYTGSKQKAEYIRTLLEAVSIKLKTAAVIDDFVSARDLVNGVYRKHRALLLSDIVRDYIEEVKDSIKPGTLKNHRIKLANLEDYEKEMKQQFTHRSFTVVEAERFKKWFQRRAATKKIDSANCNVLFYRQAAILAMRSGKIKDFELFNYVGEKDPIQKAVYLSMQDLDKLRAMRFENPFYTRICDLFLFQCFTGLSYADLWSNWELREFNSSKVITGTRRKNGSIFFIPVEPHSPALSILEKYNWKLPKYSNACYNRILKELALMANIDKRITTHTARKTFATMMNADGWSRESVARMLGHASIRTTEIHYLGDSDERIQKEMISRLGIA